MKYLTGVFGNNVVRYKRDTQQKDKFVVPSNGTFGRIKFDWQLPEYNFQPRPMPYAIPAVYTKGVITKHLGRVYDYVPLPKRCQFAIYDYLRWAVDDLLPEEALKRAYTNLIARHRAFTESHPPEAGYADYVTGRNIGALPYEWLCRTTHGNMVKIVDEEGSFYILEAINLLKPMPAPEPWLVHWATEINPKWVVSRFPQLEEECENPEYGLTPVGTPIPFFSLGGYVKVPKHHIKILTAGHTFSPYASYSFYS